MKTFSYLAFLMAFNLILSSGQAEDVPKVIHFGEVGGASIHTEGGKPTGQGLVLLAQAEGLFAEEFGKNGPQIDVQYFAGTGPAINEALAQGQVDFGSYGGLPNVIGLAGGIPAHIVFVRRAATSSYYLGVAADSPIKTVEDLRGKKIPVQKGTNPYMDLVLFLESHGLKESDYHLLNLQNSQALAAFTAGSVDALFGTTNLLQLRDQGKLRIIGDTRSLVFDGNTSGFLATDAFAKNYPETLTRVLKVLTKAAWWESQESNREALLQFLASRSSASYDQIKSEYAGSLKDRFNPLIDETSIKSFESTTKFALDHQLIRNPVDEAGVRAWFAPQYQQAALKDLNLEDYWTTPAAPATAGSTPAPSTPTATAAPTGKAS